MKSNETTVEPTDWERAKTWLIHPFTFIGLVWALLFLVFYVITEFI